MDLAKDELRQKNIDIRRSQSQEISKGMNMTANLVEAFFELFFINKNVFRKAIFYFIYMVTTREASAPLAKVLNEITRELCLTRAQLNKKIVVLITWYIYLIIF